MARGKHSVDCFVEVESKEVPIEEPFCLVLGWIVEADVDG